MIRNEFPEAEYQVLSQICEDNQVKEEISTTSCSFSYPESIRKTRVPDNFSNKVTVDLNFKKQTKNIPCYTCLIKKYVL